MLSTLAVRLSTHVLKRAVRGGRSSAAARRRYNQLLGVLVHDRRQEICRQFAAERGFVVAGGPFEGMRISDQVTWGEGELLPKLLGTYEAELAPVFAELKGQRLDLVVDVGCAEGYFAVGAALTLDAPRVVAVDIDPAALAVTRAAAALNGVADRIETRPSLDAGELRALARGAERCVVISDCEGFELELFTDETIEALRNGYCIIECHDFLLPGTTERLHRRFAVTHDVEIVEEGARDPNRWPVLRARPNIDRWLAMSESRPETMRWLVARPRR